MLHFLTIITNIGPVLGIFNGDIAKALCCYLQTCTVNVVLMVMYCMCLPPFVVRSAGYGFIYA